MKIETTTADILGELSAERKAKKKGTKAKSEQKRAKSKLSPLVSVVGLMALLGILAFLTIRLALWVNTKEFSFRSPVTLQNPVVITEREAEVKHVYLLPTGESLDLETDWEQYICEIFVDNCLDALAIVKAESGGNPEAVNWDSKDVGLWQINEVHWSREECDLSVLFDPIANTDCAYTIWDRADGKEGDGKGSFEPWVAYINKSYLSHK